MRAPGKTLAWTSLIILLLVLVLVALGHFLLQSEQVKAGLIPLAERTLHRPIEASGIRINFWSGIELQDLTIREEDGGEIFLQADNVHLRYRFWPLLMLRVVVDQVLLENPRINLVHSADGSLNVQNLGSLFSEAKQVRGGGTNSLPQAAADPGTFAFSVDRLLIRGGAVEYIDYRINPKAPFHYQLQGLELVIKNFSPRAEFPLEVSGVLEGAKFGVAGTLNPGTWESAIHLTVEGLDFGRFTPYFRDAMPGIFSHAILDMDIAVSGGSESLAVKGMLRGREIYLLLDSLPGVPLKNASCQVDLDLTADFSAGTAQLRATRIDYNHLLADISGAISGLDGEPALNLEVRLDKTGLRDALASLPEELFPGSSRFDLAGDVTGELLLQGILANPRDLLRGGRLQLSNIQGNFGHLRPALSGEILFRENRFEGQDLDLSLGDDHASLDLVYDQRSDGLWNLQLDLDAKRFNLDQLISTSDTATSSTGESSAEPEPDSPQNAATKFPPVHLPLSVDGRFHFGTATMAGLELADLDLQGRLDENVLVIEYAKGNLAGGQFLNSATCDFTREGWPFRAELKFEGLRAEVLAKSWLKDQDDPVAGPVNLEVFVQGSGWPWVLAQSELIGQGSFSFKDFSVKKFPLVQGFAEFLQLGELQELDFSQGQGEFQVNKDKFQVEARFDGPKVRIAPRGTIGTDGVMQISLLLRLEPSLAARFGKQGHGPEVVLDDHGWSQLRVDLTGTLTLPRFTLATGRMYSK